jgi:hypothetical protein
MIDSFSAIFAMIAFVTVCVMGIVRGVPIHVTGLRAIAALVVFAAVGRLFSHLGGKVVGQMTRKPPPKPEKPPSPAPVTPTPQKPEDAKTPA